MESQLGPILDHRTARALLEWQIELGVDETIAEAPVNRYDAVRPPAPGADMRTDGPLPGAAQGPGPADRPRDPAPAAPPPPQAAPDPVEMARALALAAASLDDLRQAVHDFAQCDLRRGARNCVFADGNPQARVMVIGGAPDRQDDLAGVPFAGPAGVLLDRMFEAIDMGRQAERTADRAIYVTSVLPWRTPQDRLPSADELAMMLPFLEKHVALVDPQVLVLMGPQACQALLGQSGTARLRGRWTQALARPALPMFAPQQLLKQPQAKRDAWHDLLSLRQKLEDPA